MNNTPPLSNQISQYQTRKKQRFTHQETAAEFANREIKPNTEKARKYWDTPMIKPFNPSLLNRVITIAGSLVASYLTFKAIYSSNGQESPAPVTFQAIYLSNGQESPALVTFQAIYSSNGQESPAPENADKYQHPVIAGIAIGGAYGAYYAGNILFRHGIQFIRSTPHIYQKIKDVFLLRRLRRLAHDLKSKPTIDLNQYLASFAREKLTGILSVLFSQLLQKYQSKAASNHQNVDNIASPSPPSLKELKNACHEALDILLKKPWQPELQAVFDGHVRKMFTQPEDSLIPDFVATIPKHILARHVEIADQLANRELLNNYYFIALLDYTIENASQLIRDIKIKKKTKNDFAKQLDQECTQQHTEMVKRFQENVCQQWANSIDE